MGLFDLFKSKKDNDAEALLKQHIGMMFPLGAADMQRDCDRVGELINWKIQGDELRGFMVGCKTLVFINKSYNDDRFINSFVTRSQNRITTSQAREVYIYLAGESTYRINFSRMAKANGNQLPKEFEEEIARLRRLWMAGTLLDTLTNGYGEFGLTSTNPVPTICVRGSDRYLASLLWDGAPIESSRVGSTTSDVTDGNIDIYNICLRGRELGTIYICPYHKKDCKKAPRGYTLATEN